jgi:hypothetical protein
LFPLELSPFQIELKAQQELMGKSGAAIGESYCLLSTMNCNKSNASNETTNQNLSKYTFYVFFILIILNFLYLNKIKKLMSIQQSRKWRATV